MTRQRRTFTPEFKLQLVKLYENGKSRTDIAREYNITPSALDRWIKNHQETGSFVAKDNRSEEDNELARLRKENQLNIRSCRKKVALCMPICRPF